VIGSALILGALYYQYKSSLRFREPDLQKAVRSDSITNFTLYQNQVAGHEGLLIDKRSGKLMKPAVQYEKRFYEEVEKSFASIVPYIPKYYGIYPIKQRMNNGELKSLLVMEDITYKYQNPSAIDIKIGKIQYLPNMSEKKRAYAIEKCQNSTSSTLGFRICGMQVYNKIDGSMRKWVKKDGMSVTDSTIASAIKSFYFNGITHNKDAMKYHLDKLKEILSAIKENKTWVLVSSSILLVYDSDPVLKADVRAIDFANTVYVSEFENLQEQVQYETGLSNLITEYTKAFNSI